MFFKKKKSEWDEIQKEIKAIEKHREEQRKIESEIVDMNHKGSELIRAGRLDEAKEIFESIIAQDFVGNHPYDGLTSIYRKEKDYDNEIRVLKHAIRVFSHLAKTSPRMDVKPKLERFKDQLVKAQQLKEKKSK